MASLIDDFGGSAAVCAMHCCVRQFYQTEAVLPQLYSTGLRVNKVLPGKVSLLDVTIRSRCRLGYSGECMIFSTRQAFRRSNINKNVLSFRLFGSLYTFSGALFGSFYVNET